jgi:hypothetical protein
MDRDCSRSAARRACRASAASSVDCEAGLLLPDRCEARLEQSRRLGGLGPERADLVLIEQVGQQRLDLGIAVGVELALALRGEHRGEERLGAATDALHAARVGLDPAIGYRAVVEAHRPPLSAVVEALQERFGLAPTVHSNDHLRSVAAPFMGPGQVLHTLGQVDMVVVREAARPRRRSATREQVVWREVVHDRGLAAAVGAGDGDQRGVASQAFQIERDFVKTETVADAAEALEGESEGLHMKP